MTAVTMTRLEKAATDNGFDLELGADRRLAMLWQHPDIAAHLAHRDRSVSICRCHDSERCPRRAVQNSARCSPTRSRAAPPAR